MMVRLVEAGAGEARPGAALRCGGVVRVWDAGVRGFHWLLVLAVAVAGVTGFLLGYSWLAWHLVAGCSIAFLLGARVVWGLLGATHARFTSFAYPPHAVLAHIRELRGARSHRYLGHNPLGAMMVFALILVLTAIVLAGTVALGGMLKQGPLATFVSYAAGRNWLDIHQALAVLLLVLIGLHLGGVAFETRRSRENLVAAMVTGCKQAQPAPVPVRSVPAWPWHAALIALCGTVLVTGGAMALARLPVPGLPPTRLDPAYARECGACHVAYAPSLAPAVTWTGIMDHLDQHFGEDASLNSATAAAIRTYLLANSAEHVDTLAANRLRVPSATDPLRITATPFWQRVHDAIPVAVFASRQVVARGNCNACHRDAATAMFAPQAIDLPGNRP